MTTFTAQQPSNPAIDQATLATIVSTQPEMLTAVLAHPNCYPELATYIRQYLPAVGVPQVPPVSERREAGPGANPILTWAPIALPAFGLIALISLFLPVVTVSAFGYSESANFFDDEAEGGGLMLLVFMLVAIVPAVLALTTGQRWARITAGIVGIVAGLLGAIVGFGTLAEINKYSESTAGVGVTMLSFSAAAIIVAATLSMVPKRP